jgi:hypothetical protein
MIGSWRGWPGHHKQGPIAGFGQFYRPKKSGALSGFSAVLDRVMLVITGQCLLDDFIEPQVLVRGDAAQDVVGFTTQLDVKLVDAIGMVSGMCDP